MSEQPFTYDEIDTIGFECHKLNPIIRVDIDDGKPTLIVFPEHELCLVKHKTKGSLDKGKTFKDMVMFQLYSCEFEEMDDGDGSTAIGDTISTPVLTIYEAAFSALAVATIRLRPGQNAYQFEPEPVEVHH